MAGHADRAGTIWHLMNPKLKGGIPCAAWSSCPAEPLALLRGVFTDIDDTLTRDGAIEPAALAALARLREAGLTCVAVTGRPLGWSKAFAREWPVAAIVAENGAVLLRAQDGLPDGLRIDYAQDAAQRAHNAERLSRCAGRVLRELPDARLAQDSAGRVTDIAIDHSEYAQLNEASIAQVLAIMQDEGLTSTVSSIHINGWIGTHSKWSGACWALRELEGADLAAELERWLFVGDSTNDQALFERFDLSVGVANIRRFAQQLRVWPAYITAAERGLGFTEVVSAVLEARLAQQATRTAPWPVSP